MTDERLKYIYNQVCSKDDLRPGWQTPWIDGDLIYATDGHVLLCLKNVDERDRAFEDNGEKHSNARAIYILGKNNTQEVYVELDELDKIETVGLLLGRKLSARTAKKVAHLLRLFGMEAAFVRLYDNMFEFELYNEGGPFGAVCGMCNAGDAEPVPIPFKTDVEAYYYHLAMCDDNRGLVYYHKCIEEERKAEAEYNKENFDVYLVTLKKSATICVRARSEEEAEKIAIDNVDDWDFDCTEIDSYEESCRDSACNFYEHYYDENGEQDWEEEKG